MPNLPLITINEAIKVVIIIIILVIIYRQFARANTCTYENYLEGVWVTDATFAKEAELNNMMLYVGDAETGWWSTTRMCYLIVDDVQQLITLKYRPSNSGMILGEYCIDASVAPEENDQLIWDCEKITIKTDMRRGILTIYNKDVILAVMYKANDISDILKVEEDA
ncbi:hypothetical protein D6_00094 [Faustovirus]|nr:hypothetical protein D6_00094 [Faustovirus]AMP44353.1 hypothetical protein PRJ_Dakar_00402 [Faustovirus]QKE50201.1 hypothetical protein F-VV10_0081 [Faustovirus]